MSVDQSEMELALLACVMSSPRVAGEVLVKVGPADLVVHEHQVVLAALRDMREAGDRVDVLTLVAELESGGHEESVLHVARRLPAVASELESADLGVRYAEVLLEWSLDRQLGRGIDEAMLSRGVEDRVTSLETVLYSVRSRMQGDGIMRAYDETSILRPLEDLLSARGSEGGLPYPFASMRREYGSYEKGRYSIIAGYSGDGKTTLAMQWIEDLCRAGARVCLYELEMTREQVEMMLVVQGGALTTRQIKGLDPYTEQDVKRYEARRKEIASWDLDIVLGSTLPSQMRADQMRERYDVICADHMQKFERTRDGEYADLTRYSGQLHRISRDLDCSVIALSQLRKPREGFVEPDVSQLRGTGAIVEDADDVLMVYAHRTGYLRSGQSVVIVGKMRGGGDGEVPVVLDPQRVRFVETSVEPVKVVSMQGEMAEGF